MPAAPTRNIPSTLTSKENDHETRMNFYQAAPETIKALGALETPLLGTGLEQSLIELVKTRASQINGCAFCVNMHTQDARKRGETEQRLYLLDAWREAPRLYRPRARRARLDRGGDAGLANPRTRRGLRGGPQAFLGNETVNLTMLIATINAWNRIAISFRSIPPIRAKAAA